VGPLFPPPATESALTSTLLRSGEVRRPASSASSSPTDSRRDSVHPDPLSNVPYSPTSHKGPSINVAGSAPVFENAFGEISLPVFQSAAKGRAFRGDSLGLGLSIVQEAPIGSGDEEKEESMLPEEPTPISVPVEHVRALSPVKEKRMSQTAEGMKAEPERPGRQ
jgi:hypothetical protein